MALSQDDIAQQIVGRFSRLQSARGTWEGHWEELASTMWPDYSTTIVARGNQITQGAKRTDKMYDATAALAVPKFAAALESLLTPRNSKWSRVVPVDKMVLQNRSARLWFEQISDALFDWRYSPRANFASVQHEGYMQLGVFGTAGKFTDAFLDERGVERGIRYRSCPIGELFFAENHQGLIDTCYRRVTFTARQAMQKWGEAKLPEQIKASLKTNPDMPYIFIHCVKPRGEDEGYDPKRADFRGMKFASFYVSQIANKMMQEGGYHTFPFQISRYVQAPGEVYGRSPGMLVLPNIKVLNEQKKTMLKQGHRAVDPVLLAHDDGVIDSFSLKPGAINYGGVTSDGKPLVHALPVGNVQLFREMMDPERTTINDAFLVTLFQILIETPQMTATEVLERAREKGVLLSPTMGRQHSEDLGPLHERELDILFQQKRLPPPPMYLRGSDLEYKVQYDSPLARMARTEEAAGLFRTIEFALNYATTAQDPSVLDIFDPDVFMPEIADINAVPTRWLRSLEAIKAARQGRAQQMATQNLIDAAPAAAGVIKALGPKAKVA